MKGKSVIIGAAVALSWCIGPQALAEDDDFEVTLEVYDDERDVEGHLLSLEDDLERTEDGGNDDNGGERDRIVDDQNGQEFEEELARVEEERELEHEDEHENEIEDHDVVDDSELEPELDGELVEDEIPVEEEIAVEEFEAEVEPESEQDLVDELGDDEVAGETDTV